MKYNRTENIRRPTGSHIYVLTIQELPEIKHAISAQKISSDHPYKAEYKHEMIGKGRTDPEKSYPEHEHHRKVYKLSSTVSCFSAALLEKMSPFQKLVLNFLK